MRGKPTKKDPSRDRLARMTLLGQAYLPYLAAASGCYMYSAAYSTTFFCLLGAKLWNVYGTKLLLNSGLVKSMFGLDRIEDAEHVAAVQHSIGNSDEVTILLQM